MNRQRFEALLAAYGSRETAWPAAEREAAQALLAADPWAQEQWQRARELDRQLDFYAPATVDLSARIMASLPDSPMSRFLAWLFPGGAGSLLRPALAGAMPLVVGIVLGSAGLLQLPASSTDWELQERALLTPLLEESRDE